MKQKLQELYTYRELLYTIVLRDIKVRYKQSIMGFLWALLMPVLIVMSGVVVRFAYAQTSGQPLSKADLASVAVKALPWAFLISGIRFGCNSLTNNRDLVTKVYFPKEIFPLASVTAALFDLFVASAALIVCLLIVQIGWSVYLAWLPLLLVIFVSLVTGVALIVSSASLFFRDVRYIVEVILTFAIFFTPVFYDVSMFGSKGKWLLLNPAAPLLEGFGACVARHQSPQLLWLAYSAGFGVVTLIAGYFFFKHLEPAFAESI